MRTFPKRLFTSTLVTLLLVSCGKNLSTIFFHPSVEERARDSLFGSLSSPSATTVTDPNLFRFAVFGDVQIGNEGKTRLSQFKSDIAARNVSFFVVLGDLTEDGNTAEYANVKTALDDIGIPYYVTIGNHDLFQTGSEGGWNTWKTTFGPATYSVTIAQAVRIILLDTASGDIGPTQFSWLEDQLKVNVPFTIVGSHYPIYDGVAPLIWRLSSVEERYKLTSMLMQYNVNVYAAGHIHGYKETVAGTVSHLITGSMYAYELDYGKAGYALFTYDHGHLSWEQIIF